MVGYPTLSRPLHQNAATPYCDDSPTLPVQASDYADTVECATSGIRSGVGLADAGLRGRGRADFSGAPRGVRRRGDASAAGEPAEPAAREGRGGSTRANLLYWPAQDGERARVDYAGLGTALLLRSPWLHVASLLSPVLAALLSQGRVTVNHLSIIDYFKRDCHIEVGGVERLPNPRRGHI